MNKILATQIIRRLILFAVPLGFGVFSILLGQDVNWDLQNYHLYNPYAYLTGRLNYDLAPAGLQTYFNPFLDVLYYEAVTLVGPVAVAFGLGTIQGLNFILVWGICQKIIKPYELSEKIPIFLALTGVFSVGFLSEVGTTMHDSLTAIFPLTALLIVLSYIPNINKNVRNTIIAVIVAGVVAGLGVGLKLVTAIFALAMCLSFLILPGSWKLRLTLAGIFGIGTALGLLVSGGYWFYIIWTDFGNPIFPQFNNIFHGELAIASEPIRDIRFLPKSLFEKVFYPVIFTIDPHRVGELEYKQISWLVLYFAIISFFILRLFRFFTKNSSVRALHPEARFIIAFFCGAYLLWLNIFGIYRYLIAIEVLIPLLLFVIIYDIFESRRAVAGAVILISLLTVVNLRGVPDWWHADWSQQIIRVESPFEPEPAAIFLGGQPLAWIIPALNTEAPFIQVVPNFPVSNIYWRRAEEILSKRSGNLYIVLEEGIPQNVEAANKGLSNLGLVVNTNSCRPANAYLGARKFAYSFCEVIKP